MIIAVKGEEDLVLKEETECNTASDTQGWGARLTWPKAFSLILCKKMLIKVCLFCHWNYISTSVQVEKITISAIYKE